MFRFRKTHPLLFAVLVLTANFLQAQCLSSPAYPDCQGTEPLATDGITVNSGTSKWYYGAAATFNYLKLNGGTLVVCGDLVVDKFEMDSGRIFILPGARFVVGNGIGYGLVLKGNSSIYNAGTLEILRNLSFDNGWATPATPNILINDNGGILKMNNQYLSVSNASSWFVNRGQAYFHGLITDNQASPGSVCLGYLSEMQMTVLYNRARNTYVAPDGIACVSVSEFTQLWDTLARDASINMCLSSAHKVDSSCLLWGCKPGAWGKANLFTGCNGCIEITVLTVQFRNFGLTRKQGSRLLEWEMSAPSGQFRLTVEWSPDGKNYQDLDLPIRYDESARRYSSVDLSERLLLNGFYRIRALNQLTGIPVESRILHAEASSQEAGVYPNPFHHTLHIALPGGIRPEYIELNTMNGSRVWQYEVSNHGPWEGVIHPPPGLPAGMYILRVVAGRGSRIFRVWHQ